MNDVKRQEILSFKKFLFNEIIQHAHFNLSLMYLKMITSGLLFEYVEPRKLTEHLI